MVDPIIIQWTGSKYRWPIDGEGNADHACIWAQVEGEEVPDPIFAAMANEVWMGAPLDEAIRCIDMSDGDEADVRLITSLAVSMGRDLVVIE